MVRLIYAFSKIAYPKLPKAIKVIGTKSSYSSEIKEAYSMSRISIIPDILKNWINLRCCLRKEIVDDN
jgi:hypothetical protein